MISISLILIRKNVVINITKWFISHRRQVRFCQVSYIANIFINGVIKICQSYFYLVKSFLVYFLDTEKCNPNLWPTNPLADHVVSNFLLSRQLENKIFDVNWYIIKIIVDDISHMSILSFVCHLFVQTFIQ